MTIAGGNALLLSARGIRVRLGSRPVLAGVDVELRAGQLTALVGPNGAGKSTLLRALAGVVPLEDGEIQMATGGASRPSAPAADQIAYLPQDRTVHWDLSVARVVGLGRLGRPGRMSTHASEEARAIEAAMDRMDVAHLSTRSIREISGGERARVLVARALAQDTPILLADEPVAGLDPAHQLALFEHLRALVQEGKSIVVSLHELSYALRFADRVVLLHRGHVVADGPPSEALSRPLLAEVFGIDTGIADVDGVPTLVPLAPIGRHASRRG